MISQFLLRVERQFRAPVLHAKGGAGLHGVFCYIVIIDYHKIYIPGEDYLGGEEVGKKTGV